MNIGDVQISTSGSFVLARITGEVDLSNAHGIGQAVMRGTSRESAALVLDLSGLEYMDSAGIQIIYRLREDLRARAQELRLVIPAESPAADALKLAGITSDFNIVQTADEALRAA
jgi:anti-sigma B factor antagonist